MTATIRTTQEVPTLVARAIRPDNTDEMETTVEGDRVVTRIERETTGGLHSNVDDYVVNLDVATAVAQRADGGANACEDAGAGADREPTDAGTASDAEDNTDTQ
ncbi:KEOPS complex subunit Pcc1 [Natrialbaceae archaeon GCM10025810]|uniref:KEOPS complex subunit Pcc1 n=1 Tax=Halovalidus salilacus TaxID=3075124 RepID=UPI00361E8E5B